MADINEIKQNHIQCDIQFFTTSTEKLILMSISTLGIYQMYWFYKNWVAIKNSGKNCIPFMRTLFSSLYSYSCFRFIRKKTILNNIDEHFPAGFLAATYFIMLSLSRLPDPYWIISFLSFAPIIIANDAALAVNKAQDENFVNNDRFSKWNYLTIVLGGMFFIFCIISAFFQK